MRREEVKKLGAHVDNIVRHAEASERPNAGCFGRFWTMFVKARGPHHSAAGASAATIPSSSSSRAKSSLEINRAIFGLAGMKKGDPASKLEEAAAAMKVRIEQLEKRSAEGRAEAKRLAQTGQKAAALRALKKTKAVDQQVDANQASLMAVEQQVDMLAQAAMQKTLSSALATTSKAMKKDAKALNKAESAIDDASEARDMASDLNQVMAEFAANGAGDADEDDLMSELEAMMMGTDDPQPPPTAAQLTKEDVGGGVVVADKQLAYEEAEVARQQLSKLPSVPREGGKMKKNELKREERAGLLAS